MRATAFTLIEAAKLNGVDPQAGLIWVIGRIADHKTPVSTSCRPGVTLL